MTNEKAFQFMFVLLVGTAVVWWAFCIAYYLRSKWWKNPYGRNTMSVGAAVAGLHTMLAVYVAVDRWSVGFTAVASALLIWSLYSAARRIYLMDKTQKEADRH